MERLEISEEATNIAMQKGVLDMLVSIPPDRVATAGIAWVKQQIMMKCDGAGVPYAQEKWRSFWVYFRRVWIAQFPPAVWSLHGLSDSIISRTSNPLEQFHRELDAAFTLPDPGLPFSWQPSRRWRAATSLILQRRRLRFQGRLRFLATKRIQATRRAPRTTWTEMTTTIVSSLLSPSRHADTKASTVMAMRELTTRAEFT